VADGETLQDHHLQYYLSFASLDDFPITLGCNHSDKLQCSQSLALIPGADWDPVAATFHRGPGLHGMHQPTGLLPVMKRLRRFEGNAESGLTLNTVTAPPIKAQKPEGLFYAMENHFTANMGAGELPAGFTSGGLPLIRLG
jgi:hypothetical protein